MCNVTALGLGGSSGVLVVRRNWVLFIHLQTFTIFTFLSKEKLRKNSERNQGQITGLAGALQPTEAF
jgi:hypothetical protein